MGSDENTVPNPGLCLRFCYFIGDLVDKPITWVREQLVEPNRQKYYWYHEKFRRVPTVDECYSDDVMCIYEANCQFIRDRKVDKNILNILRKRYENCSIDHLNDESVDCKEIHEYYKTAINNYFIKYGDLGTLESAYFCYMKQKHRMAWERRYGPVGTGMNSKKENNPNKSDSN